MVATARTSTHLMLGMGGSSSRQSMPNAWAWWHQHKWWPQRARQHTSCLALVVAAAVNPCLMLGIGGNSVSGGNNTRDSMPRAWRWLQQHPCIHASYLAWQYQQPSIHA
eukprot:1136713-Pelagomonas_calceolata.AAC.5